MSLQAVPIREALSRNEWEMLDVDDARLDLRGELGPPVVTAAIVVEVEVLHALDAVEADPLGQVWGLIAEDRADRQADRRAGPERRTPALAHVPRLPAPVPESRRSSPEGSRRKLSQPLLHRAADGAGTPRRAPRVESMVLSAGANCRMLSSFTASTGIGSPLPCPSPLRQYSSSDLV